MIDRVESKMFCKREDSKIMCTKVYMQLETWVRRCRTWLDKLASVCCGYWACVFPVFKSVFCNMLW
jgi:hypothetical protein